MVKFDVDAGKFGIFFPLTYINKEAEGSWKPIAFRGDSHDWPTVVLGVGASESLPRLRTDAKWWFHNSEGSENSH